jgi:glutathione S-transferase
MLKLHGFSSSNYYNVPKLALLEKGQPFEEVVSYTGVGPKYRPEYLQKSPLGKVPCLETPEGFISESRAILEYIERAHPEPSLLPDTPFGVAKVQEFSQFIELYFENQVLLKPPLRCRHYPALKPLLMAISLRWPISLRS